MQRVAEIVLVALGLSLIAPLAVSSVGGATESDSPETAGPAPLLVVTDSDGDALAEPVCHFIGGDPFFEWELLSDTGDRLG